MRSLTRKARGNGSHRKRASGKRGNVVHRKTKANRHSKAKLRGQRKVYTAINNINAILRAKSISFR